MTTDPLPPDDPGTEDRPLDETESVSSLLERCRDVRKYWLDLLRAGINDQYSGHTVRQFWDDAQLLGAGASIPPPNTEIEFRECIAFLNGLEQWCIQAKTDGPEAANFRFHGKAIPAPSPTTFAVLKCLWDSSAARFRDAVNYHEIGRRVYMDSNVPRSTIDSQIKLLRKWFAKHDIPYELGICRPPKADGNARVVRLEPRRRG